MRRLQSLRKSDASKAGNYALGSIRHPCAVAASLSSILLFAPGLLSAAQSDTPPEASDEPAVALPTVQVNDETYRQTATKSVLPTELTPQSISVIDQDTLQMRNADSVNEALRYVSGVNTELRGGAVTRMDQFVIRGFPNYQNYYDGLPLLYNGWNLQPQIDAAAIEQVEVFKGPTSSLYGNMPPGGFVNLIGKRPSSTPFNRLSASTGTRSLRETSFDSRGALGDTNLSYSAVGLARRSNGQAVTSDDERYLFAPSVDWRLGEHTLLNVNLYYQKDPSAGIYNTIPAAGSVFGTPFGRLDTDAYAGDANWNTYEREVVLPGYRLNHDFGNGWSFLHQLRYQNADANQKNTYNTGLLSDYTGRTEDQRLLLRRAYLTDETANGMALDNQLAGQVRTGAVEHNLLLGVDYQRLDSDIAYEDAATVPIDLFAPNHHLIDPATLDFAASGLSSDFTIDSEQRGFYLQDQLRWNRWVFIASGRHDQYDYKETGRKYGAPATSKIDQQEFSVRTGLLYAFDSGWAPYVNYAQSFEPVGGSDRSGNTFEPATAEQWEVGLKYASADRRNQFSVAAFEITKENDLTRDPNGGPYDLIQAGETRSRGVELETRYLFTDALMALLSATWLDMEITKDTRGLEGKTPVWVPDVTASLWLQYDLFDGPAAGTTLGAGVRYVGETQIDALNTGEVPDYTVFDLAASYDLGRVNPSLRGTTLQLTANNLTDHRYVTCYDRNNCWFGAERTVEVGVQYDF
ncbi:TonB-dependent siderophore receptor [Immundisolibacter sp.]|uniref:TonB-dependent siderophore receptor n=1 Tax=Immundisolibacter sp. TaxID=1934948 RepID=UPI00262B9C0A|nr:TonB-dependent siderophore receptor [Immundisolibacter sp.]MDD3650536.1 TonB-dependent siderophore receptor [Immundisolibacter sp.]